MMGDRTMSRFDRYFWLSVDKDQVGTGCWEWTGFRHRLGYGLFGRSNGPGSTQMAHRRLWFEMFGPIEKGMELDHLCRNRACVNPAHLELVTHAENMRRGAWGEAYRPRPCKHGHDPSFRVRGKGCTECYRLRLESVRGSSGIVATKDRTSCPQGHPYDIRGGHGERACSICLKAQRRAWYERKKAAQVA